VPGKVEPRERGLSEKDLDGLARRWLELEAACRQMAEEQAGIKARLRYALDVGAHDTVSGAKVTVSLNRRFDAETAEQVIPAELRPIVEVTVIDAKKAKEFLPPKLYEACRVVFGDPRVTIS
jgi:hypothetical protein